jgi:GntR family transcriptional regulator
MEITIDIDNPVPQFEQLIEQIKAAVTGGVLKPGDSLPSIRQLANDLELNSKTTISSSTARRWRRLTSC